MAIPMARTLALLSAAAVAAASASGKRAPLALMAVGDWGGESALVPANAAEKAQAAGMAKVAKDLGATGVLLLGDNFYLEGVSSNQSSRFAHTFEDVYKPDMFGATPFYVVAGNHDHRGNVQAQIDYHGSARWHFPSLYYTLPFSYTSTTGVARKLELVMIDTCMLAGVSDDECQACELPGPPSVEESEDEWSWLAEQLSSSKADFLWVGGHYPIYSAGQDGTTKVLVDRLLPLLKQHGAHYISGHDHMHQHIEHDGVHMFVTGPGRECCYKPDHLSTIPDGALRYMVSGHNGQGMHVGPKPPSDMLSGFSSMQADDVLTVTMYKEDGTALYSQDIPPRATARHQRHGNEAAPEVVV